MSGRQLHSKRATHRKPDHAYPFVRRAQLARSCARAASVNSSAVTRWNSRSARAVSRQQRRHNVKAARKEGVAEIAKCLRCVARAVEQQNGRGARALEHEPLTTDHDSVRTESSMTQRKIGHRPKLSGAPPGSPHRNGQGCDRNEHPQIGRST